MAAPLERRITDLERQSGIGDASFLAELNAEDRADYRRIMSRQGPRDYEAFIRTLEQDDLEALLDIHLRHLVSKGVTVEELAVIEGDSPLVDEYRRHIGCAPI